MTRKVVLIGFFALFFVLLVWAMYTYFTKPYPGANDFFSVGMAHTHSGWKARIPTAMKSR
ncbi:MAG: hypothetical protein U0528_17525 [Anaerolineae bacterium]